MQCNRPHSDWKGDDSKDYDGHLCNDSTKLISSWRLWVQTYTKLILIWRLWVKRKQKLIPSISRIDYLSIDFTTELKQERIRSKQHSFSTETSSLPTPHADCNLLFPALLLHHSDSPLFHSTWFFANRHVSRFTGRVQTENSITKSR